MPRNTDEIEAEVLKRVTPTPKVREKVVIVVESLLENVAKSIERYEEKIETLLVGSIARDTWLPPNPDIDIFMMFPLETSTENLVRIGLEIGEDVLEGEKRYAEHPYTHGIVDGFEVDIVPCYKIDSPTQRMTAVDRTPLHQKYVIEHLKEEQKQEVRLLKRFLKGVGIYGAEAKIQGFSGYLTELIILRYGTFNETVKNASAWKAQYIIEFSTPEKEFDEPLIVTDPIDAGRNVASALSLENFAVFVTACKAYLEAPKLEFFFPNPVPKLARDELGNIIKNRATCFIGLIFEAPEVVDDILYPQLRKCLSAINAQCTQTGFKVHDSAYEIIGNEALMLLEFEVFQLPKVMKHIGPPVWVHEADRFLDKWRKVKHTYSEPYIEDEHWTVDIPRKFTNVKELIKELIVELNLGKNINDSIQKGYFILENEELLEDKYLEFLSRYFNKKLPWEN